ncbi:MAG: MFS transporter [Candidatus Bathyarchaeota archaeon]|nr:MFS transporter [Candidatus Bathyarchaeota archaeon]
MLERLTDEEKQSLLRASLICVAIFFADASHSLVIPIFPTFAQTHGASLTMIGLYGSAIGVAMVLLSVPIGGISDKFGRKAVLLMGFTLFILVPLIYIVASSTLHLLAARLILGIAMGSTFGLGFVWVTEEAHGEARVIAQELYMTAMGIGFTLGPIIGGYTSTSWGFNAAFAASSILGFCGLIAILLIKGETKKTTAPINRIGLRETLADPRVLAAGLTNFINSLLYSSLSTFFPLYGLVVGLNSAEVGLGFTVRGQFSTIIRYPASIASKGRSTFPLLIGGLVVQAAMIAFLASSSTLNLVLVLLAIQGVMYGISLTAGNVYVTAEAPVERRGAAMGVYQSFSNASNVICPIILGSVAESYGVAFSLQLAATASIFGIALCIFLSRASARFTRSWGLKI